MPSGMLKAIIAAELKSPGPAAARADAEGFDLDSDPQSGQQVTDSENSSVPRDPQEPP